MTDVMPWFRTMGGPRHIKTVENETIALAVFLRFGIDCLIRKFSLWILNVSVRHETKSLFFQHGHREG